MSLRCLLLGHKLNRGTYYAIDLRWSKRDHSLTRTCGKLARYQCDRCSKEVEELEFVSKRSGQTYVAMILALKNNGVPLDEVDKKVLKLYGCN